MKNQYFGDINDYLKYGLLRCFAGAGLRIGVCWMMTANDGRPDGRKTKYLSNPKQWREYDPLLFDSLDKAIRNQARHVRHVQTSALIPNASFDSALVPDDPPFRTRWLLRSLRILGEVDLIFFDPDNGIEVQSVPVGKKGSDKYLFWDEIAVAWDRGVSLLIFQHFARQERESYVCRLVSKLAEHVPGGDVLPLFTSNVVYLLAYQPRHDVEVSFALNDIGKRWSGPIWRQ